MGYNFFTNKFEGMNLTWEEQIACLAIEIALGDSKSHSRLRAQAMLRIMERLGPETFQKLLKMFADEKVPQ